jgi:TfoX/Sxy family transcriptional regulator of competence genes
MQAMPTQDRTVAFLQDQLSAVRGLSIRKMFGEYGVWVDGKTVGLVCNDQLFIKPTAAGKLLAADAPEASPYRGARPSMLIDAELWEDADWLCGLVRATSEALPAPKPKRAKQASK